MTCSGRYFNQYISSLTAGLAVLCVGCSVGWTTPTLKKLKEKGSYIHLTSDQSSWLAAAHEVGHFLSPIPAGLLMGRLGRKQCLLGSSFISIAGWIVVLCSETVTTLYFSRFLFGISMGIVFTIVPLYIAEVSSPEIRGALSTCFQAMLYFGHLIEFSVGPYVSFMFLNITSLTIALVATFCLFFLVESPLYSISIGKKPEASLALSWLLKTDDGVDSEIDKIEKMLEFEDSQRGKLKDLFSPFYRHKLAVVIFTAVAQRFTGMSAIVAYAESTFPSTTGGLNSEEYTILFGALVFVFTFVSAALIDRLGRRPLILFSCLGCAVAHFVSGTYFYEKVTTFTILPFLMISSFSVIYSLGLGPLVNTLQGELFPPHMKGLASSLVTVSHAASSFAVTKLFQFIRDRYGIYLNFYIFSISCAISFAISYFVVPETKRIELEALQRPRA